MFRFYDHTSMKLNLLLNKIYWPNLHMVKYICYTTHFSHTCTHNRTYYLTMFQPEALLVTCTCNRIDWSQDILAHIKLNAVTSLFLCWIVPLYIYIEFTIIHRFDEGSCLQNILLWTDMSTYYCHATSVLQIFEFPHYFRHIYIQQNRIKPKCLLKPELHSSKLDMDSPIHLGSENKANYIYREKWIRREKSEWKVITLTLPLVDLRILGQRVNHCCCYMRTICTNQSAKDVWGHSPL